MARRIIALCGCLVCPADAISNPTGSCEPSDNGARPPQYFPGPGDTYLPDCRAPLQREYWRVFATSETQAYVIPRPDGLGLSYGLCGGNDSALAALAEQYDLCTAVVQDPSIINSMAPADALTITHSLHERLVFTGGQDAGGSWQICPFPPDVDVLAACELTSDAGARGHCDSLRSQCDANGLCTEMYMAPSEQAVRALVPALNELYGIEAAAPGRVPLECSGGLGGTGDAQRMGVAAKLLWCAVLLAVSRGAVLFL